jgi:adenosylcobinamide kinase/adenosylcobinamide-phosphate guanylyltransferase
LHLNRIWAKRTAMSKHTLILGGAKSGKSSLALELANQAGGSRVFLATAQAGDGEMTERIRRHQAERGPEWSTLEEPIDLHAALKSADREDAVLVVDCLTLWLSNLLTVAGMSEAEIKERSEDLAALLPGLEARVILVANEVGLGIVPDNALARLYRDLAGGLNQQMARVCGRVILVTAGLPLVLKGEPLKS